MTVRKSEFLLPNPTTGQQEKHHLETELEQIADMDAYMRGLNKKTSAAEVRKAIEAGYFRRARKTFTLADLSAAVASGDYNKYDILPGDYFTGASGYAYIFAGHNPLRGGNASFAIMDNHAGLIVNTSELCTWNDTNDTTGGYVASNLHSYLVNTVLPKVKTDLGGVSHLYSHKKLYTTRINATGYNRFGEASGCSNYYAWSADQYISALTEVQVYGSTVWSSSGFDTGEAAKQLYVFKMFNQSELFGGNSYWLRDVASSVYACRANNTGIATYGSATNENSVVGLIAFH